MDPDYEYKQTQHFKTRATGVLFLGPLQQKGYDNRVIKLTANEMEFTNSEDAQKFMEYNRKKYSDNNEIFQRRRMKMISKDDD